MQNMPIIQFHFGDKHLSYSIVVKKHMRKKARAWKNMLIIRFQCMEKIKLSTWAEKKLSDPETQRSHLGCANKTTS